MATARAQLSYGVAAVLVVIAAAGVWRSKPLQWPLCRRLAAEGSVAQGQVAAKGGDSETIYYTFQAGEKSYGGVGPAGYGNPEFGELSIGDNVLVSYLPKSPDISMLGLARERLRDQNRVIALSLLIAAPILFLALRRELDRH